MRFTFVPLLEEVARFEPLASIKEFNDERPVSSADGLKAVLRSGDLTKRIISVQPLDNTFSLGLWPTIDTRVHRLMPGMYPAIPGWHCDDVPRETYDSQPDLSKINPDIKHYTAIISSSHHISDTEFVIEPFTCEIDPKSSVPIWQQVHIAVEKERPKTKLIESGVLYRFNQTTIHRATPAKKRGWRLWYRMSLRPKPPLNNQTAEMQVYLLSEESGW